MKRPKARQRQFAIILAVTLGALLIAAVGYGAIQLLDKNQKTATNTYNPQAQTGGASKDQSGGVTDNNSPAPSPSVQPSSPAPSTSTAPASHITVSSPVTGAKVSSGTVIAGSSPGSTTVYYRIKDNVAGVLTTGQLSVNASGQFSGTVSELKPRGTSGYIEVYNVNPTSGVESNNVKVSVTF